MGHGEADRATDGPARPLAFAILDDDADSRFLNRRALQKAFLGCVVVECSSAEDALEKCAGGKFNAILADHHLRGFDGIEFISKLRQKGILCPVLMVTNSRDPGVREKALSAGASAVFCTGSSHFIPYLMANLIPPKASWI